MVLSPSLIEAIESVVVALIGSSIVAPVASALKRKVGGSDHSVSVKLPSGKEVRLQLDDNLSREQVSELVAEAVRSAQSGDESAVRHAVDASRAASEEARATASN